MQQVNCEIAVLGAGVVGLCIAHRLAWDGHEVVLVDPGTPGMGASYGNAGTIADYAVQPVGTPGVLKALPSLLFDRNSPLAIRHAALASLAPWLVRFAVQCLPARAEANARVLARLLDGAAASWASLAEAVGASALLQARGCLYLYESPAALRAAQADLDFRRTLGVSVDLLDGAGLAALEPGLPEMAGAAHFPQAVFMSDPGRMVGALARATLDHAGYLQAEARKLTRQFDGIVVEGPGLRLHAQKVVIAMGAHSRGLAAQAGDRVPLETERGYHAEWDMAAPRLNRPACPTARGFYLCPMSGRLRVAGTVELGGLTAPPSPHRIRRLVEGARTIFPDLGEPDRTWMGFRPSLPDSLAVIGPSSGGGDVLLAFGHGHIGLTLAPVTARLIADLVAGRAPELDLTPFRPGRF